MPPPTSPSRTSLTSSVGASPDSVGNSNFVSRDFLHRMNELSANLLNQYTEPETEDHPVYSSPPEGPRMTSLPARIRNLASPIHFLPMPDLDLDMDLDMENPRVDLSSGGTSSLFSAPELDELSESALSSDSDGEFENSEMESVSDDSSDGNLDNEDEDDDENDSDSTESGILDRIQSAQRLLLSSARQNHTNRNTLINSHDPRAHRNYGTLGGLALRRSNAIHVKNRRPVGINLENMAREYHADFSAAVRAIKGLDSFVGKSPIFSHHPHALSRLNTRKWGSQRRSIRRTSYEGNMDRFLNHRRRGMLWSQQPKEFAAGSHEIRTRKPEAKRKRPSNQNGKKRRKVSHRNEKNGRPRNAYQYNLPAGGEKIDPQLLSRSDKFKILDGLPCSYLKSGSSFALDLLVRGNDSIDLSFSDVDLTQKTVHGHFNVKASGDRSGHIHLIIGFLSFLCGGIRSRYTINCTNKVIQTKSAILDHTFMEAIVERGLSNPNVVKCLTSAFQIPFSGEIVDFNKNDLRFLPETRPVSSKSSFSRSMHVSRVRNEQIKMQMSEWLKVRPFHNFSEAFFLNYLFFVEKYLREFMEAPKSEQELGIEFAKQMKESIYDITRDFDFMNDAKIPMVEEKSEEAKKDIWERRRHEPRSNLHKSTFVQEWETKMCEKLCDYITCEDSCLLNIQLNYVLFTVRVDVSAALDQTFQKFIGLVTKESERKMLQKKYDAVSKEETSPEARECVFVCSLNRKTGRLEMQNTRSNLDYKNAGSCESRGAISRDSFGSTGGSFTDSDEDEIAGPASRYSAFSSHWKVTNLPSSAWAAWAALATKATLTLTTWTTKAALTLTTWTAKSTLTAWTAKSALAAWTTESALAAWTAVSTSATLATEAASTTKVTATVTAWWTAWTAWTASTAVVTKTVVTTLTTLAAVTTLTAVLESVLDLVGSNSTDKTTGDLAQSGVVSGDLAASVGTGGTANDSGHQSSLTVSSSASSSASSSVSSVVVRSLASRTRRVKIVSRHAEMRWFFGLFKSEWAANVGGTRGFYSGDWPQWVTIAQAMHDPQCQVHSTERSGTPTRCRTRRPYAGISTFLP